MSQSRDTDMLHVPMLPHHATLMYLVVSSAVRSSGDGKAKSRGDTHATNCEAGTRETSEEHGRHGWSGRLDSSMPGNKTGIG